VAAPKTAPARGIPIVAIVGRPNVGKSSLVNRLVGEERVVVSDVPGTTRDAIDVHVEHAGERFLLVDTAGLRRVGRRTLTAERGSALMTVRALERANVAFVVIDAAEGATDQDARVANLALERGCAVGLLANKWDLVAPEGEKHVTYVLDEVRRRLRFLGDAPLLTVSAKTGAGVTRIFEQARKLAAAGERKIGTAELNRWLAKTVALHDPAMAQRGPRRKPVKFYYATQMGTRPPTFVLFCSEPDAVQSSYRRFLENQLRDAFELSGTPVRVRLRSRR
jgi:GTP-binding protein